MNRQAIVIHSYRHRFGFVPDNLFSQSAIPIVNELLCRGADIYSITYGCIPFDDILTL